MAKTMPYFSAVNIYQYMYMFQFNFLAEVKEVSLKYLRLLHLFSKPTLFKLGQSFHSLICVIDSSCRFHNSASPPRM